MSIYRNSGNFCELKENGENANLTNARQGCCSYKIMNSYRVMSETSSKEPSSLSARPKKRLALPVLGCFS